MKFILCEWNSGNDDYGCARQPNWESPGNDRWFRFFNLRKALKQLHKFNNENLAICICIPIWFKKKIKENIK